MSNNNGFHDKLKSNVTVAKIMKPVTAEFYYQIRNELQNRELKTLYRRPNIRAKDVVEQDVLNLTPIKSLEEYNATSPVDKKLVVNDGLSKKYRYFDENFREIDIRQGRIKKSKKDAYVAKNDIESGEVFRWDAMLGRDAFHHTECHDYFKGKENKQYVKLLVHKRGTHLANYCPLSHEASKKDILYNLVNTPLLINLWKSLPLLFTLFVFDLIVNYSQYTS